MTNLPTKYEEIIQEIIENLDFSNYRNFSDKENDLNNAIEHYNRGEYKWCNRILSKYDLLPYQELTSQEVFDIDERIFSTITENPQPHLDDYEFYVRIYFRYDYFDNSRNTGNQEFISENKNQLLQDIKKFIRQDHESFRIVFEE